MMEFLRSTSAQAVLWTTVLVIFAAVGVYVALWVRDRQHRENSSPSELLSDFRQLHDQGDLSQAEFQRIKSLLGEKLQNDLESKDAENTG
jgi:hypothetical protein